MLLNCHEKQQSECLTGAELDNSALAVKEEDLSPRYRGQSIAFACETPGFDPLSGHVKDY